MKKSTKKILALLLAVLTVCMVFAGCGKDKEPTYSEYVSYGEFSVGEPYSASVMVEGIEENVSYSDVNSPLGYIMSIDRSFLDVKHIDDSTDVYFPVGGEPYSGDYGIVITKETPCTALIKFEMLREEATSMLIEKGLDEATIAKYLKLTIENSGITYYLDTAQARADGVDIADTITIYRIVENETSTITAAFSYTSENAEGIGTRLSDMARTFCVALG